MEVTQNLITIQHLRRTDYGSVLTACSQKDGEMFECDQCGKKSKSRHALANHKRFHKFGPFRCHICGQSFGLQSTSYNHKNKHRDTPYICAVATCNYSCKSWVGISEHNKYGHATDELFLCEMCDIAFQKPSNLYVHHYRKHGPKGK